MNRVEMGKRNIKEGSNNNQLEGDKMDTVQEKIIQELAVQPEIDEKLEIRKRVMFMKSYLKKNPFASGFVLGISGGQDSTLLSKLAQIAVNELNEESEDSKRYQFIAVRLPYGVQADEQDAQDAIEFVGPDNVITVDIKPAVDASVHALKEAGVELTDFVKGNDKARERMKVQYNIAAMEGLFVLGTDHAAEAVTGFYTKHGDGACDLAPLFGLNKRQGKQLLQEMSCPPHLYLKMATADLEDERPRVADEVALGVTYQDIDDYLEGKEIARDSQKRIEELYDKSRHKRYGEATIFDEWWKK